MPVKSFCRSQHILPTSQFRYPSSRSWPRLNFYLYSIRLTPKLLRAFELYLHEFGLQFELIYCSQKILENAVWQALNAHSFDEISALMCASRFERHSFQKRPFYWREPKRFVITLDIQSIGAFDCVD